MSFQAPLFLLGARRHPGRAARAHVRAPPPGEVRRALPRDGDARRGRRPHRPRPPRDPAGAAVPGAGRTDHRARAAGGDHRRAGREGVGDARHRHVGLDERDRRRAGPPDRGEGGRHPLPRPRPGQAADRPGRVRRRPAHRAPPDPGPRAGLQHARGAARRGRDRHRRRARQRADRARHPSEEQPPGRDRAALRRRVQDRRATRPRSRRRRATRTSRSTPSRSAPPTASSRLRARSCRSRPTPRRWPRSPGSPAAARSRPRTPTRSTRSTRRSARGSAPRRRSARSARGSPPPACCCSAARRSRRCAGAGDSRSQLHRHGELLRVADDPIEGGADALLHFGRLAQDEHREPNGAAEQPAPERVGASRTGAGTRRFRPSTSSKSLQQPGPARPRRRTGRSAARAADRAAAAAPASAIASSSTPRNRERSGKSHIVKATRPPGRSTRANSAAACSGRPRCSSRNPATTASKDPSSKRQGLGVAMQEHRPRGALHAPAPASPRRRRRRSRVAPRRAAAAAMCPGPVATSSTVVPGPTPAASSSGAASRAVIGTKKSS